ncbi:putative RNA-directed DNA polymerase [Helianthus annuus]|nr:putative RNA-directed DNA polymerase [Helianthus annuus]
MMKQWSRDRWLMDGDENSKYFHYLVNRRKANNGIFGLSIDGVWCEKPSLIKKFVFEFFRDKFKESAVLRPIFEMENCKCLSAEDGAFLTEKFSHEEIKKAVFECGPDRAPGPDGFNFRFFKHFWRLFETDFVNILEEFYLTGKINRMCAASFIALIPKKKDPVGLGDYRPISLVGVVNKVISKILANRMKLVLESVISESQSAFLKDKFILDGPLVVSEIHTWLKKKQEKSLRSKD